MDGKGDDYPEAAFYMQGTLEEAFEEGKKLAMQAAKKWLNILREWIKFLSFFNLIVRIKIEKEYQTVLVCSSFFKMMDDSFSTSWILFWESMSFL